MDKQYTHILNLSIGLDLTKLLSPKNIPGVKAYLGIDSDVELVNAIAQDQYSRVNKALQDAGFEVIKADFDQIQQNVNETANNDNSEISKATKEVPEKNDENVEKHDNKAIENPINRIDYDVNAYLVDQLKPMLETAKKDQLEVTTITINGNYVIHLVSNDELKELVGLDKAVEIDYDELDSGQLAIINFVDRKENMTFEIINEKETEKVLDGKS